MRSELEVPVSLAAARTGVAGAATLAPFTLIRIVLMLYAGIV